MARRALWFGLGAASGCVAAVWGLSSVRRASQRLTPDRVSSELADSLRDRSRALGEELRDAVAQGREAMLAREDELRSGLKVTRRPRTDASARPAVR